MQLVITVKDGSTNKDIANALRWQANLIDGMDPKKAAAVENTTQGTTAKATGKKAAAPPPADEDDDFKADDSGEPSGFDDAADDEPVAEASFDDAEAEEPPKKTKAAAAKTKAKKITLDDVNDACKAHAAAKGRPATLQVLQKKFKTQSVTALKPEQYETCISAMAVN